MQLIKSMLGKLSNEQLRALLLFIAEVVAKSTKTTTDDRLLEAIKKVYPI